MHVLRRRFLFMCLLTGYLFFPWTTRAANAPILFDQNGQLSYNNTGKFDWDNTNNFLGIGTSSPVSAIDLSHMTDALALPVGTDAQRPASPVNGMLRYNSSEPQLEAYIANAWTVLSGSGGGTITLGTSASVTNPQRNGDATTGLFSPATDAVAIASGGTEEVRVTSGGVGIGTASPGALLDIVAPSSTASSVIVRETGGTGGLSMTAISGYADLAFGAKWDGTNWRALYTDATILTKDAINNIFAIDGNSGLTAGNSFTPSTLFAVNLSTGNIGIGTTSPQATLDVSGYARLAKNSSQPVACSSTNDGAIALTDVYTLCICNGNSTSWVQSKDGSTACSW